VSHVPRCPLNHALAFFLAGRRILTGKRRRRQDPRLHLRILVIARLFRADWMAAGNPHKFVVMRELHHLARREQRPGGLLSRHHQVRESRTEPMAAIVFHGAHFRRSANCVRDAFGSALVAGR
jgi:hypothetical protein